MDTRDLIEERENLKQQILDSFLENFPHYEEMTDTFEDILFEEEEIESWKEDWEDELQQIEEINDLENEVGSEFEDGVTLIEEDEFEDYCQELVEDCGYISKDFPSWIEVDWSKTAYNMRMDYSETEFRGTNYLWR
jgi:hypothetical protein